MVVGNQLEVMMQKMEQVKVAMRNRDEVKETLRKELQAVKKKEVDKEYVQTWENNATPETHDPSAS